MPRHARGNRAVAPLATAVLAVLTAAPIAAGATGDVPLIGRGAPGLGPVASAALTGGQARLTDKPPVPDQYIVQLDAPPLSRYQGGARGFAATAPAATGAKVDRDSAAARAWTRELDDRQAAVLAAAAPAVTPSARYRVAFAGFAAKLTAAQVQALRAQPGVAHVTRERFLRLAAAAPAPAVAPDALAGSEAALMGLPTGLWKQLGGAAKAGSGTIVGVVDSGITPESASFADHVDPPALWDGACQAGERFPASTCDDKLIGARYFVDGFGRENLPEGAYLSPRDEVGHGTHVASIAVGDAGVDPLVDSNPLGVDRITGVAPAAHLAVYKACWVLGFCSTVDIVAAIDAAVGDGVDVINLSLGGSQDPSQPIDPIETATLNADAAGVFVAAAAGNAGDTPGALGTPASAPWTTAVAATTGTRTFRSTLHVSAGGRTADVPASTTWPGFTDAELLDARSLDPNHEGSAFDDPRYCAEGLTREQVGGKVVLCDAFAPAELVADTLSKAQAKGFILIGGEGLDDPIVHTSMPAAVVERSGGDELRAVTAEGGGVAALQAGAGTATPWTADRVAGFSSRGPGALSPDLLRPDVSAPGVNVVAAYAPDTYLASQGFEARSPFAVLSGTSMASPQVAGIGALLTQLHPGWSPAQMRSALVTTARPVSDAGQPASPRSAGAGRVDPTAAADPGLVIAPSTADYHAFAEQRLPARDLNLPSIEIGRLLGSTTVTRTVTSVAATRASWTASVRSERPGDVDAGVTPQRFTIAPGQSQALAIDVGAFEGARGPQALTVVLRNGQDGRTVDIPVALTNPGIEPAPGIIDVSASGADADQPVTATVSGTVHPTGFGLAAPQVRSGLHTQSPEFADVQQYTLPVTLTRESQLLAAKVTAHDAAAPRLLTRIYRDVDGDGRWTPVDQNDEVSLPVNWDGELDEADAVRLPAGAYLVQINAIEPYASPIPFDLRTWQVDDPRPDDPAPAPGLVADGDVDAVSPAQAHTFHVRVSGVGGSEPLRGLVEWNGAGERNVLARSIVRVTPGG